MTEIWDDGTWFEGYEEHADYEPLPPGVTVWVGPGVHSEVTLPDGSVHRLPSPIVMSGMGAIFIAQTTENMP